MKASHWIWRMVLGLALLGWSPRAGVASNTVLAAGGDWIFDAEISNVAYRIHVFTNVTTSEFIVNATGAVDYLVIAGGGAGGSRNAGGGGAGGVIIREDEPIAVGSYPVAVGAGGARNTSGQGDNGSNSSFFGSIAIGGGGGGTQGAAGYRGKDGGSGGGRGVQGTTTPPRAGQGLQTNQTGKSWGYGHNGVETSSSIGSGGGGAGDTGSGTTGGPGMSVSNLFTAAIGENGYVGGGGAGDAGTGGVGGAGDSVARHGGQDALPSTGGGGGGGLEGSGVEVGGGGGSGVVAIRYTCLSAEQFTIADPDTGSTRFTNSNEVDLVDFPVPEGYNAYQITEDGGWSAIQPLGWTSTGSVPATLSFAEPGSDAVVTLYAWFTNTTTDVPVRHTSQQIRYTTVGPDVVAKDSLFRASSGSSVAITGEELDNGSTGGMFGDRPIGVYDVRAVWNSGPYGDTMPGDPFVTMTPYGSYGISLVVINEAGNVATASVPTTVQLVRNLATADGGDLILDARVSNITYRVHVFTNVGTSTFTVHTRGAIDYLVVGGGGGGGGRNAGGGGAGGVILSRYEVITQGVYQVTVGGGAAGGSGHGSPGSSGTNSSFYGAIALGGGGGGAQGTTYYGRDGGSGGGRGAQGLTTYPRAGQGLQPEQAGKSRGYGNDGYETSSSLGTGGGGAGTTGATYDGGAGILVSNIFPLAIFDNGYVGGGAAGTAGGGGSYSGGIGGGGDSHGSTGEAGDDGMAHTGGGGGGGSEGTQIGGVGGSGVVVIRYEYRVGTMISVQ